MPQTDLCELCSFFIVLCSALFRFHCLTRYVAFSILSLFVLLERLTLVFNQLTQKPRHTLQAYIRSFKKKKNVIAPVQGLYLFSLAPFFSLLQLVASLTAEDLRFSFFVEFVSCIFFFSAALFLFFSHPSSPLYFVLLRIDRTTHDAAQDHPRL